MNLQTSLLFLFTISVLLLVSYFGYEQGQKNASLTLTESAKKLAKEYHSVLAEKEKRLKEYEKQQQQNWDFETNRKRGNEKNFQEVENEKMRENVVTVLKQIEEQKMLYDEDEIGETNKMAKAFPQWAEGGYADKRAVFQGERIMFYIANTLVPFTAEVIFHRSEGKYYRMKKVTGLIGNNPRRGLCSAPTGCRWDPSLFLDIPLNWPPGVYRLEFEIGYHYTRKDVEREGVRSEEIEEEMKKRKEQEGDTLYRWIPFVVMERIPSSRLLFLLDVLTPAAHNIYGGGSLYLKFNESGIHEAYSSGDSTSLAEDYYPLVSLMRPLVVSYTYHSRLSPSGRPLSPPVWSSPWDDDSFRLWLEETFPQQVSYVTNDIFASVGLDYLRAYPCIVIAGAHKFWSSEGLAILKQYVRDGGNVFLSAQDFAWGNIRFRNNRNAFEFYWSWKHDPQFTKLQGGALERAKIHNLGEHNNIASFFGLSLQYPTRLVGDLWKPVLVANSGHWSYEDTLLMNSEELFKIRGVSPGALLYKSPRGRWCFTQQTITCDQVEVLGLGEYPQSVSNKTYSLVSIISHDKGKLFIGPGKMFNSPEVGPFGKRRFILNILERFSSMDFSGPYRNRFFYPVERKPEE